MLRIYSKKIAWISLQPRIVSKNIQFYSSSQHENGKIDHPWLKLCKTQNVLPDYQRVITFMVGNTTSGNLDALKQDWKSLPSKYYIEAIEALLQTHLFAGFPKVINALSTVQSVTDKETWKKIHEEYKQKEEQDKSLYFEYEPSFEECNEKGRNLMELRFGTKATQITDEKLSSIHPVFYRWIQAGAYGRVLSRPGLDNRMRALCIVASLSGLNVPFQLYSHIKASMRLGCTKEEVKCVLEQTELIYGKEAQKQVDEIWKKVEQKSLSW